MDEQVRKMVAYSCDTGTNFLAKHGARQMRKNISFKHSVRALLCVTEPRQKA